MEDALAKEFTALHKRLTGRGPLNVRMRLLTDVVSFRCTDALTPLERALLSVQRGGDRVSDMRRELLAAADSDLRAMIRRVCEAEVQDIRCGICPDTGRFFGVICLDRDPLG